VITLELIELCGAKALEMDAKEHDRAMALVSHAPQVIASVVAGQLIGGQAPWLDLVGQGFKDMTRIADSDPSLWREILSENSENISTILKQVRIEIENIERVLNDPNQAQNLIENGNSGRKLIPGKHGSSSRTYIYLHIVIDDKAGQLAAIFNDCARADVNIEDVSIEHTPGQNTGLVTLSILEEKQAKFLQDFLLSQGWKVHSTSK
jgi:prephenate dehydrogenase